MYCNLCHYPFIHYKCQWCDCINSTTGMDKKSPVIYVPDLQGWDLPHFEAEVAVFPCHPKLGLHGEGWIHQQT